VAASSAGIAPARVGAGTSGSAFATRPATTTGAPASSTPSAAAGASGAGTSSTSSSRISSATGAPTDIASIRSEVEPGLVDIHTILKYETEEAWGTGMVLTSTGKILTNNHVIEGYTSITVTDLGNSQTYGATVLGYTKTDDVALLQLQNASGLTTVSLGNSSTVTVGEPVVGIGNAGGLDGTPSAAGGSVSALGKAITASDEGSLGTTTEHLTGLVESDCDIQPGDSGGPLVTTSGKVVAMDTAASGSQGFSFSDATTGQGYSIPIDTALSIVKEIEAKSGSSTLHIGATAFLGVYVASTSTATTRREFGFGFGGSTPSATATTPTAGALVEGVISGTPAATSGLTTGDVITSIGGHSVTSVTDVTKIVMGASPGQTVKVTWTTRTGQAGSATLTLATGPPN
jgi:S1-C subfamily serine protease